MVAAVGNQPANEKAAYKSPKTPAMWVLARSPAPRHEQPGPHGSGIGIVHLFICLVQDGGVSMRGASRVLQVVFACLGIAGKVPHWTTGRLWLQRLGLARLLEAKEQADDWAWLADHS